jgi:hypothetical protein
MADNAAPVDLAPSAPPAPAAAAAPATAVADAAAKAVDKAKNAVMKSPGTVITILIVVAAALFGIAYLLYWLINNALINKKAYLIPETKVPKLCTELTKINGVNNPMAKNGKRMSFSFWIYIHDVDKYKGALRHVMHLGDEIVLHGSPIVYLGANDNKMYIAFNTINDVVYPGYISSTDEAAKFNYLVSKYGITIDYIPIQRWVHIAVVVNEDTNSGSISAYVDSELVKTMTTGKPNRAATISDVSTIQNLKLDKAGAMFVGGSIGDEIGPGFSGLVSKIKLYNYDLNVRDVYGDYRSGPIDNLLAKLGLPAYGVRTPVYRIG